mmetsp:Transcript_26797/g.58767  ORF Transcript_26797/g.58767 Transcript_26797/m.58767 type:complete len:231 (-) Transcript_26797:341-1033(-)
MPRQRLSILPSRNERRTFSCARREGAYTSTGRGSSIPTGRGNSTSTTSSRTRDHSPSTHRRATPRVPRKMQPPRSKMRGLRGRLRRRHGMRRRPGLFRAGFPHQWHFRSLAGMLHESNRMECEGFLCRRSALRMQGRRRDRCTGGEFLSETNLWRLRGSGQATVHGIREAVPSHVWVLPYRTTQRGVYRVLNKNKTKSNKTIHPSMNFIEFRRKGACNNSLMLWCTLSFD